MAVDFSPAAEKWSVCYPIFPGPGSIDSDTVGTVAFWIRPETVHNGMVFWAGNQWFVDEFLRIYVDVNGYVIAAIESGGVFQAYQRTTNAVYAAGDVLHVAVTQDTVGLKIYVNGVKMAQTTVGVEAAAGAWIGAIAAIMTTVTIGAEFPGKVPGNYFDGFVYDLAYWNIALTQMEIYALGGHGQPIINLPLSTQRGWCRLYFPMDELTGSMARDVVGAFDLVFLFGAAGNVDPAPAWVTGQIGGLTVYSDAVGAASATVAVENAWTTQGHRCWVVLTIVGGVDAGVVRVWEARIGALATAIEALAGWKSAVVDSAVDRFSDLLVAAPESCLGIGEIHTLMLERPKPAYPRSGHTDLQTIGVL